LAEKNGTKKSKRVEKKEKREKKRELAAQLRKEVTTKPYRVSLRVDLYLG
jgi:hypothetical protein